MKSACPLTSFKDDKLQREDLADYLSVYIKTTLPAINTNSLVIALNSPWGTGKTSFINMWMNKLKETSDSYNIINYNAWENDDCPEAIIPLICSFSQLAGNNTVTDAEMKSKIISVLKELGPRVINSVAWGLFHIDISDITDVCSDLMNTTSSKTIYEEYTTHNKKKDAFRDLVNQFASEDKPLLIFVDELDRCRPTFAIETLEAVKHFFDLKNVIFVFSMDIEQLSRSIRTIYGEINCVAYLQRFFDYQIPLPSPNLKKYLRERLVTKRMKLGNDVVHLCNLADRWELSLRDINVICDAYLNFIKRTSSRSQTIINEKKIRLRYLTLITLKYSNPVKYLDVMKNGVEVTTKNNKFLQSLFELKIDKIEDVRKYFTNEVAQTQLINDGTNKQISKEQELMINSLISPYFNIDLGTTEEITLSQAVFNILEYGNMIYPNPKMKNISAHVR